MRWAKGRQDTGYFKLKLWEFMLPIPHDLYLIKYPKNSFIPPHKDPAPSGYEHWRINLELVSANGGVFTCENSWSFGPLHIFQSSKYEHSVSRIESGTRWVVSFGFIRRGRNVSKN